MKDAIKLIFEEAAEADRDEAFREFNQLLGVFDETSGLNYVGDFVRRMLNAVPTRRSNSIRAWRFDLLTDSACALYGCQPSPNLFEDLCALTFWHDFAVTEGPSFDQKFKQGIEAAFKNFILRSGPAALASFATELHRRERIADLVRDVNKMW